MDTDFVAASLFEARFGKLSKLETRDGRFCLDADLVLASDVLLEDLTELDPKLTDRRMGLFAESLIAPFTDALHPCGFLAVGEVMLVLDFRRPAEELDRVVRSEHWDELELLLRVCPEPIDEVRFM